MTIKGHDSSLLSAHVGICSNLKAADALPGKLIEEKPGDTARRAAGQAAKLQATQEAEGGDNGQR